MEKPVDTHFVVKLQVARVGSVSLAWVRGSCRWSGGVLLKRFVAPPNWPIPPRRNWIPPESWRPDPSWPPAPPGWHFWRDGNGKAVLGPIGRYGAPSRRAAYAGAASLLVFLAVNIWAVSVIGLFGGGSDDPAAVTFVAETPSAGPPPSSTPPVVQQTPPLTTVVPEKAATSRPAKRPTPRPTRTSTTMTPERSAPTPTRATVSTPVTPSRPTSRPSTREQILRQYCIDRGIDPSWCEPANWEHRRP